MGRTIPSYRLAAERERIKWKIFGHELDKSERKMFELPAQTRYNLSQILTNAIKFYFRIHVCIRFH